MSNANVSRWQHVIPAACILALAASVAWLSFTREPAAAFLFPRMISVVMLVLAMWNFVRAVLGLARVGDGLDLTTIGRILPGIMLMLVYVFFLAKWLGFYAASLLSFFVLYTLYDPSSHKQLKSWVQRVVISVIFMVVIYGLFSLLLKVQTPRGLFL